MALCSYTTLSQRSVLCWVLDVVEHCHAALFTATEHCTLCPSKRWLVFSCFYPKTPSCSQRSGFWGTAFSRQCLGVVRWSFHLIDKSSWMLNYDPDFFKVEFVTPLIRKQQKGGNVMTLTGYKLWSPAYKHTTRQASVCHFSNGPHELCWVL